MFRLGDAVIIRKLHRAGRVTAIPKPGHYEVTVDTLVIHCKEADLEKGRPSQVKKERLKPTPRSSGKVERHARSPDSIDLHGLTVEEAMKRVEEAINRALLEDKDCLRIVHGLGTGRIRQALHAWLAQYGIASHYKIDDGNPGVTIVYF